MGVLPGERRSEPGGRPPSPAARDPSGRRRRRRARRRAVRRSTPPEGSRYRAGPGVRRFYSRWPRERPGGNTTAPVAGSLRPRIRGRETPPGAARPTGRARTPVPAQARRRTVPERRYPGSTRVDPARAGRPFSRLPGPRDRGRPAPRDKLDITMAVSRLSQPEHGRLLQDRTAGRGRARVREPVARSVRSGRQVPVADYGSPVTGRPPTTPGRHGRVPERPRTTPPRRGRLGGRPGRVPDRCPPGRDRRCLATSG